MFGRPSLSLPFWSRYAVSSAGLDACSVPFGTVGRPTYDAVSTLSSLSLDYAAFLSLARSSILLSASPSSSFFFCGCFFCCVAWVCASYYTTRPTPIRERYFFPLFRAPPRNRRLTDQAEGPFFFPRPLVHCLTPSFPPRSVEGVASLCRFYVVGGPSSVPYRSKPAARVLVITEGLSRKIRLPVCFLSLTLSLPR